MKKILPLLIVGMLLLTGCGGKSYELKYKDGKELSVEDIDCVAVYTEFDNESGDTVVPADEVDVKAFQNGTELSPIVPTGTKTDGYIQCDASVQDGTKAKVVWIFQLDDKSDVSVELSDGTKETISLQ